MTKKFSLKEIALQSGLSLASIDRVLHDRPNVSASAKRRVELAIRELERQHEAALTTGRRFVIDVIMQAPKRFTTEAKAINKTKRRFNANIVTKRFYIPEEGKWIKLKVSTSVLKTINKKGISAVLKEAKEKGIKL